MKRRRAFALGLVAGGLVIGTASVAAGRAHPGWWFAGESDAALALGLLAGLLLVGAGAGAWLRRPDSDFGPLLVLAGYAWFVPEWNNPDADGSLTFTLALVLMAAAPALVAHAALAYPGGRLRSAAERLAVASLYGACLGLVGLLPTLVFDPTAGACTDCPRNLLLISPDAKVAESLQRLGLRLGAVSVVIIVCLGAWRLARTSAADRRLTAFVLAPACVYLVAVALDFLRSAGRGFLSNDSTELWLVHAAALCLVSLAVTWEWVRSRRTRAALAGLVIELEHGHGSGVLGGALARRLRDPTLELLYPRPDGRLIDATGSERAQPHDRRLTPLLAQGRTLALAAHRPELFDDPNLAGQVVSALRLPLENERLQAELRAQLGDLRASRARIVEAGDRERRRLERDLHDGAQQRLVALSLSISLALVQRGGDDGRLARAQVEATDLLAELRRLAHGIYPVALAEEGFAAAVEELAEGSPVGISVAGPLPEGRLDPSAEAAAYLLVRELSKDDGRRWTSIRMAPDTGRMVLEVSSDGDEPVDLVHLEDRVGAVGGHLHREDSDTGVIRLRAELPCG